MFNVRRKMIEVFNACRRLSTDFEITPFGEIFRSLKLPLMLFLFHLHYLRKMFM